MLGTTILTIAAALGTAFAQTGPGFPIPATSNLIVKFGNNTVSPAGELIPRPETANPPNISTPVWYATNDTNPPPGVLLIVDLDVPRNGSRVQLVHQVAVNVTLGPQVSTSDAVPLVVPNGPVPYLQPSPPVGDVPHSYNIIVFQQPTNFSIPAHASVNGEAENSEGKRNREIVLGRNLHTMCFSVTEPDADDEVTGDREAYMASILARYRKSLVERTKHHLGYPYNLDFDYGALAQLQPFSINNLGDPFIESNYGVHSRQFEVGVLDWFARLWEIEKNEYWGYITNCGTEGNLHGILLGREVFPDGILYASQESHYSIFKAARMYRMECIKVDTLSSGEIDCVDFKAKLLGNRGKPAIVNVNIGTTVKGAVDDLDLVIQTLEESGFSHDRFYIHCDGALFGLMMPFVKRAPKVTFKKPIGSVSVSGHKFMGCPMPCGVQITRLEHINALSRNVEYLASRDATIMGSRNGHAPIFLWYTLNRKGYRGFQKEVQKCLRNAHYLKDCLQAAGIGAMLNELSSTVVFERPQDEEFVRRWQLACQGNIAHVVVMPNVTIEKLDNFLSELFQKRLTLFQDGKCQPPCIEADIGKENCTCALHN